MMLTTQRDALHHIDGVTTDDQGVLKPDWKSFSLPDCFQPTLGKLSDAKNKAGNAFFTAYGKLAGRKGIDLYNDAVVQHLTMGSAAQVGTLALALEQAGGISKADAYALANYTGGGVLYKSAWGGISPVSVTASEYLEPDKLVDQNTKQITMEAALLRLKAANPMVHNYILALIGAKAAKRAAQEKFVLGKDTQKVINKELEIAKTVVETAANYTASVGEGIKGAFDLAGFFARNWLWIAGVAGAGLLYLAYRNRDTLARAGMAYATGGTSEVTRALKGG